MTSWTFRRQAVAATVLVTVVSLVLRWPGIHMAGIFNPDEAELLAAGRRASLDLWHPLATYSANTYFPLWPTFLGALDLVGVPMTLPVAHTLSALAVAALTSMLWVGTARRWGWLASGVLVAPPAISLLVRQQESIALNTELPSVCLVVLAATIAFWPAGPVSGRRLALVAALASLAPWFKPQSAPLAVALVVSAWLFAQRQGLPARALDRARMAGGVVLGGLAPTVALVGAMWLSGTLQLFWQEPVGFLLAYVNHDVKDLGPGMLSAPMSTKAGALLLVLADHATLFLWAYLGLRGVVVASRGRGRATAAAAVVWVLPLAAAVVTLLVVWPIALHYLNFLYAGAAVSALAGAALVPVRADEPAPPELLPVLRGTVNQGVCLLAVGAVSVVALLSARPALETITPARGAGEEVARLCPRGSSVFVWGWAAELYAAYDWKPASRYVTYGLLAGRTPDQGAYRERFLREMRADPPQCVVNAVGKEWWHSPWITGDLDEEVPATRRWLDECYSRIPLRFTNGDRATVWQREPGCRLG